MGPFLRPLHLLLLDKALADDLVGYFCPTPQKGKIRDALRPFSFLPDLGTAMWVELNPMTLAGWARAGLLAFQALLLHYPGPAFRLLKNLHRGIQVDFSHLVELKSAKQIDVLPCDRPNA